MTAGPDRQFWQDRFERRQTPWDRGAPHPQLLQWRDEGRLAAGDGARTMAVPGCGRGHELQVLAQAGWQVTGLDYADAAVALARQALDAAGVDAAQARVEQADVLQWQPPAPLDAVYEQTCLCALHPDHWRAYADALHAWLRPGGRLLLLAMQSEGAGRSEGRIEGPPYHLHVHALRALFSAPHWDWPAPPYAAWPHPSGWAELGLVLTRR